MRRAAKGWRKISEFLSLLETVGLANTTKGEF
jgi:hypothetical protein